MKPVLIASLALLSVTACDLGEVEAIPEALQGRWGIVSADCDPARADAKGLMTVGGETLRFYESVATVGRIHARGSDRIEADFALAGEGQTWTRRIALATADGGETLVREEYGAEDGPLSLTYRKCR